MERELKYDSGEREEGEEQLSTLIKQAGNAARMRKQKMLEKHFDKLKEAIAEGTSRRRSPASI